MRLAGMKQPQRATYEAVGAAIANIASCFYYGDHMRASSASAATTEKALWHLT